MDDEAKNRMLMRAGLEARGYQVEEADNGAAALKRAKAGGLDVVLMDVSMPVKDGLEACKELKADPLTAPLQVIMVTALSDRSDRLAGIAAGANDYLTKPVDLQDLVLRVANAVAMKRLHDRLEDNLRRLEELERLRDSLTHMVVHDLRSPLGIIAMSLELMALENLSQFGPEAIRALDSARRGTRTMSDMITALLDVSRLEAGKMPMNPVACDLGEIARRHVEELKTVSVGRELTLRPLPGPLPVKADVEILRRIIGNLIGNAIKFTPSGGKVSVALASSPEGVRFEVTDTGGGIAPEHHQIIFEKFGQVQDRNARLGTGLGLPFCKLAVETHGGRIGVESQPGQGSTFWFTLPPERAAAPGPAAAKSKPD